MSALIPSCSIAPPTYLNNRRWAVIGGGNYVRKLIDLCHQSAITLPEAIYSNSDAVQSNPQIDVRLEAELLKTEVDVIVIGSDTFQFEILNRVSSSLPPRVQVVDCSAFVVDEQNSLFYSSETDIQNSYSILFDTNPAEHVRVWFKTHIDTLAAKGITTLIIHPLATIEEELIVNAQNIYLWNGSTSHFINIKYKLDKLGVNPLFVECGFFPQKEYFYIDPNGINAARANTFSDLSWVNSTHLEHLEDVKSRFFATVEPYKSFSDYVFVPLQLSNDSNIQNHSRFKQGMQEFIDYIQHCYPDDLLIFKVHPKDESTYQLRHGIFSDADSRALILGARIVHGINSTVLFEAALAGKHVIAEGECLLNLENKNQQQLIAAIVATQIKVTHEAN